jgi:adiponectin receptor
MASSPSSDSLRKRRPSNSLLSAVKHAEQKVEQKLLLLWDDLPAWRRDNAFILSGYRPTRPSYTESARSLFYLHNEFVNIWSHLAGAIVAIITGTWLYLVIHPRYETANPSDVLVFACFFGSAVVCLGMSATYHALTDHSQEIARWGNKLDYTGIVALIVGSYVPTLYYGFFCHPILMTGYLYLVSGLSYNTQSTRMCCFISLYAAKLCTSNARSNYRYVSSVLDAWPSLGWTNSEPPPGDHTAP